jgi:Glyoxalase-like domain
LQFRSSAITNEGYAMHRSKLSTFVIDCQSEDLPSAAAFWSQALGRAASTPEHGGDRYQDLESRPTEPLLMVQKVDHPSRVHLDIEADDIEAEVLRLEALGATRIEKRHTWWVMRAPTGHVFCVVRPQRGPLGEEANAWP